MLSEAFGSVWAFSENFVFFGGCEEHEALERPLKGECEAELAKTFVVTAFRRK